MTEKCPNCGGSPGPFDEVTNDAFDTVLEFSEAAIEQHCPDRSMPDFFGEALLSGLLQGVVAAAFAISDGNIEAVKSWLLAEIETAIEMEALQKGAEEGSMVQ